MAQRIICEAPACDVTADNLTTMTAGAATVDGEPAISLDIPHFYCAAHTPANDDDWKVRPITPEERLNYTG